MSWKELCISAANATEKNIERLCHFMLLSTGLCLLAILTLTVILRYGMETSVNASSELVALLFPVFVMAGIAQAALQGAHVATQLLLNSLNAEWRIRLTLLIHAVTASTYLWLAWYAFQSAVIAHDELSTILHVPGSVGYGALAVGLGLVGVCSVAAIVRHLLAGEAVHVNLAEAGPGVV
ncbi:TRAP transporter small permease [Herbaspirillum chlorophenolicum]|jgi:TRAP-type C4-dicarboxylate transport system permease small subunit|uniref:TRAP transporter small permease protein n=1 Tax=Herbaspirillum chlorophenolicum TaxID=211589 RepID=A0ABW8EVY1_9BURK|nr:TRAP transporter small permease subunit [Herbaspirillum chlorophenolicum]